MELTRGTDRPFRRVSGPVVDHLGTVFMAHDDVGVGVVVGQAAVVVGIPSGWSMKWMSEAQIPQARVRTRICPAPGTGSLCLGPRSSRLGAQQLACRSPSLPRLVSGQVYPVTEPSQACPGREHLPVLGRAVEVGVDPLGDAPAVRCANPAPGVGGESGHPEALRARGPSGC